MSKFTPEKRRELAKQSLAMPDGGYPIRNRSDLVKATQAYGRGTNKPEIKRWIKKRAKDLHAEKYLPDDWEVEDSDELAHYDVKGMKWGVRRYLVDMPIEALRMLRAEIEPVNSFSPAQKAESFLPKR